MRKIMLALVAVWISGLLLTGCASSKAKVFGEGMPTMKTIHDEKFHRTQDRPLIIPPRALNAEEDEMGAIYKDFQWLPNPTLVMHVFKHLTPAGHPVPGYNTFFQLYKKDHIAAPGESEGWE